MCHSGTVPGRNLQSRSRSRCIENNRSQVGVPSKREAGSAVGQPQDSEEREGEHGAGWAAARAVGRGEVAETAAGAPSLEGKTCVRRPR